MVTAVVTLEIDKPNKRARIVDNSDYSSITGTVSITGTGTVIGPSGMAIATGVTVDISGGDTESAWFNLPQDSNGNVLSGTYKISVYTPTFAVTANPIDQFTTGPNTIWITENWEDIFDEVGATNSVTVAAATTPGNDGSKSVVSAPWNGMETEIVVSQVLTAEAGGSATITFSVTYNTFIVNKVFTYSGCDEVTPAVSVDYDCDSTQFGQIIFDDETVLPTDQTLVTAQMVISYPGNLSNPTTPADVTYNYTTPGESVTLNALATGTWTYRLTYTVEVEQTDGLIIQYTATSGAQEVVVNCAGTLCGLLCCVKQIYQQAAQSAGSSTINYSIVNVLTLFPGYYAIAKEAKTCGDNAVYEAYVAKIQALINDTGICDSDCGCDSDEGNKWINNAGYESQSTLENLVLFVEGLAEVIGDNTAAAAAYNDLVTQMNNILAQAIIFTSNVGLIEAQINALDPEDPAFDDQVDLIEANLTSLIASFGSVQTNITTLQSGISAFQTAYTQFSSYWDNIVIQYNLVSVALDSVDSDADALLTLLGTLTPVNYAALIAGIQSDITDIAGEIADINSAQITIANQIQGLLNSLLLVWNQVNQNTLAIANLPAAQDEIFVAQASVDSGIGFQFPAVNVPAQYFDGANGVKGYVKFRIEGSDVGGVTTQVEIYNISTSQSIWTSPTIGIDSFFTVDVILQFDGTDFYIAGSMTTGVTGVVSPSPNSYHETILSAAIPTTTVLQGAVNRLEIRVGSLTTQIYRQEIHGVKMF